MTGLATRDGIVRLRTDRETGYCRGGFQTRPLLSARHGIDLVTFIVMPNQVQGIINLADQPEQPSALPEIMRGGFKTFSPRRVNERAGKRGAMWQRGYYEHVIRNEKALARIRAYIAHNPVRWADDPENISRAASAERRAGLKPAPTS